MRDKFVPYFSRNMQKWKVRFHDRAPEFGEPLRVAAEYISMTLCYNYHVNGEEYGQQSFSNTIEDIMRNLRDGKNVDIIGYEEQYSKQELEFIEVLIIKMSKELGIY